MASDATDNEEVSSALTVLLGAIIVIFTISKYKFNFSYEDATDTSVNAIGTQLLSYGDNGYILPFEVISVLLLAAMISAIIIAKKIKND